MRGAATLRGAAGVDIRVRRRIQPLGVTKMLRRIRRLSVAVLLVLAGALVNAGTASAHVQFVCGRSGPETLSGKYDSDVLVVGVCQINAQPVTVNGNVIVQTGGDLQANFLHNHSGHGPDYTGFTVAGSLTINRGGSTEIQCDLLYTTCPDVNLLTDTHSAPVTINGDVRAYDGQDVLISGATIHGKLEVPATGRPSARAPGLGRAWRSPRTR